MRVQVSGGEWCGLSPTSCGLAPKQMNLFSFTYGNRLSNAYPDLPYIAAAY